MSNSVLEELKMYFQNTPPDKIKKDWAETDKYDQVGPTISDFVKVSKYCFNYEGNLSKIKEKNNILANPKFSNLRVFYLN